MAAFLDVAEQVLSTKLLVNSHYGFSGFVRQFLLFARKKNFGGGVFNCCVAHMQCVMYTFVCVRICACMYGGSVTAKTITSQISKLKLMNSLQNFAFFLTFPSFHSTSFSSFSSLPFISFFFFSLFLLCVYFFPHLCVFFFSFKHRRDVIKIYLRYFKK